MKKGGHFKPAQVTDFQTGSTRLELATSCVTGRRSNQLNYDPVDKQKSYTSFRHKKIGAVRITAPIGFLERNRLVAPLQCWPIVGSRLFVFRLGGIHFAVLI